MTEDQVPEQPTLSRKLRTILKERLYGPELNLCPLVRSGIDNEEWARLHEELSAPEWKQLHQAAVANGGAGIAHVECEAAMLPSLIDGLHHLTNVDSVSVWVPVAGGSLDFGTLGQDKPLRAQILGTPSAPLQITACDGLAIEGKEAGCPAIQKSLVQTRRPDGTVAPDSRPLPVMPAVPRAVLPLPRLADTPLLDTLHRMLRTVASQPKFAKEPFDEGAVAMAFINCADFDEQGDFGFDLKRLTPQQVRCIQALPVDAWAEVQDEVEEAGWLVTWLDIHEDFSLGTLAPLLLPLSPLSKITVSAPKGRGFFIDLAGLQSPELTKWHNKYAAFCQLQEVAVRPRLDKHFVISVPHSDTTEPVKVVLANDAQANSAHLQKSSIYRVDITGRTVGQQPFIAS